MGSDTASNIRLPPPLPLANAANYALFLDLDGTIAPLASKPYEVKSEAARNQLLKDLAKRCEGRLAVVSGRSIFDLDRILSGCVVAVAGVHGLERRTASGERISVAAHPGIGSAREVFSDIARREKGVLFEDKGVSVALHYRNAPTVGAELRLIAERLAVDAGIILQEGEMVVELRTPGPDKGDALRSFLQEAPFAGSCPVFVGDDLTDECAFEAAREAGGSGVLVGSRRPTNANRSLRDVNAVLNWLKGGGV